MLIFWKQVHTRVKTSCPARGFECRGCEKSNFANKCNSTEVANVKLAEQEEEDCNFNDKDIDEFSPILKISEYSSQKEKLWTDVVNS